MNSKQMEYNEEQLRAMSHEGSPLMIEAGAGTGKTTTIVGRVVRLIERGVPPRKICMLTFTNKAAKSMKSKLALASGSAGEVFVGTIHYAALRMLRSLTPKDDGFGEIHLLGNEEAATLWKRAFGKAFGIEELKLLKNSGLGDSSKVRSLHSRMVCGKMDIRKLCRTVPQASLYDTLLGAGALERVFGAYAKLKSENLCMDFDDILGRFDGMLDDEGVLKRARGYFTHYCVDEYQDTSIVQASILKKLVGVSPNITVVGDPNQSIFSFISAYVGNMLGFARDFPGAQTVRLSDNYRSTSSVLGMTNLILEGTETECTPLKSAVAGGYANIKPKIMAYKSAYKEAADIVSRVKMWMADGVPAGQIAVLSRFSVVPSLVEQEFIKEGIPYVKYGGVPFARRTNVRVFLSLLDLSFNRRDYMAWETVLQLGAFVGEISALKAIDDMKCDVMWDWKNMPGFSLGKGERGKALKKMWELMEPFASLPEPGGSCETSKHLDTVFNVFCELYSYYYSNIGMLKGRKELEAEENMQEMDGLKGDIAQIRDFAECLSCVPYEELKATAENFKLDSISEGLEENSDRVVISTIHSAKGLEWEKVVVMGLENGILPPSDREYGSGEHFVTEKTYTDEEKRLFYVASTRAKEELVITYSLRRMGQPAAPSAFLENLMRRPDIVSVSYGESCSYGADTLSPW